MRNSTKILIILLIVNGILLWFILQNSAEEKVIDDIINQHYTNEDGIISNYPLGFDSTHTIEFLSESIGLYLQYLLLTNQKEAFNDVFLAFVDQFVVYNDLGAWVKWQTGPEFSVNASIDDYRIIKVLIEAAHTFNEEAYEQLSLELKNTIQNHQLNNGYYVDIYDWNHELAGSTVFISFITVPIVKELEYHDKTLNLLIDIPVDDDSPFFLEVFNVHDYSYEAVNVDYVHMIDQLIIAMERNRTGLPSPQFDEWLFSEISNNKLFGRYDRTNLNPTVDYESASVYAYLYFYLLEIEQIEKAEWTYNKLKQMKNEMVNDISNVHFFDLILTEIALRTLD